MASQYLIDLIILLLASAVAVPVAQALRLGAVPGFLLAGMLVGPAGFGLITRVKEVSNVAEMGVVLLLFVIGMEMKPSQLWRMRRMVFGLGSLQVVLTGLVLALLAHFGLGIGSDQSALIGPALALSSTAFVIQLLSEQNLLISKYGRASFSILLFQDLAVVPLFALVPLLAMTSLPLGQDIGYAILESIVILTAVMIGGKFLLQPLLHRAALSGNSDVFTGTTLLVVLASAYATEHAGMSMAMGAFLAGLLISDSVYRHQIMAEIQPFRGLLLGIFFMSMGMSFNPHHVLQNPTTVLTLVFGLIVVKTAIMWPLVSLFRIEIKTAFAVAFTLAQSGEFALVLFSIAHQSGLLSTALFQLLIVVVLLSMLITPLLAKISKMVLDKPTKDSELNTELDEAERVPIVIAGFGRVGRQIGNILNQMALPYVAFDSDAALVAKAKKQGYPVFFGDVTKYQVLRNAHADTAKSIVVTINKPKITEDVVSELKRLYPKAKIYARGHSKTRCKTLYDEGAEVVSETIEVSLELSRLLLSEIGCEPSRISKQLKSRRKAYYGHVKSNPHHRKK